MTGLFNCLDLVINLRWLYLLSKLELRLVVLGRLALIIRRRCANHKARNFAIYVLVCLSNLFLQILVSSLLNLLPHLLVLSPQVTRLVLKLRIFQHILVELVWYVEVSTWFLVLWSLQHLVTHLAHWLQASDGNFQLQRQNKIWRLSKQHIFLVKVLHTHRLAINLLVEWHLKLRNAQALLRWLDHVCGVVITIVVLILIEFSAIIDRVLSH